MQYFDCIKYGERIKEIREIRNMKQLDLAIAVGYSDSRQIQRIEVGSSTSSIDKLVELAQALDISTDYLLFGKEKHIVDNKISDFLVDKSQAEQEFAFKMLAAFFENKNLLVS